MGIAVMAAVGALDDDTGTGAAAAVYIGVVQGTLFDSGDLAAQSRHDIGALDIGIVDVDGSVAG